MISSVSMDSQSWRALPWGKFQRHLFGLQKRVFKATRIGDIKKVRSLQKLILRSEAAKFLAVHTVTQLNTGKRTAGIDVISSLSARARFKLAQRLDKESSNWKHKELTSVPNPKKDDSVRPLRIPTIADRAWQCLAKYVIEPAHEGIFHERSYGFRPGRSSHDAQKFLCSTLNKKANGYYKRVIELDIEKCFDRLDPKAIMTKIDAPSSLKLGIFRCLKAGVNPEFREQITPQGGVINSLLANIILDGIENLHQSVRYAGDIIFILKPQEDENVVLYKVKEFLAVRGLNVNNRKTRTTLTKNGFDFLGWRFVFQDNGKFKSFPSRENFNNFLKKVKGVIHNSNLDIESRVTATERIVRGWRQYHKYCKMSGKFNLWGITKRACHVFNTKKRNKMLSKLLTNRAFPSVSSSENSFINVKESKTPFDGDLIY